MVTPKWYADDLLNRFDTIIYTDQNHDEQVMQCALEFTKRTILLLQIIYCNTEDNSKIEMDILKEQQFYEQVQKHLEEYYN